ncbi:hypothetical protein AAC387_Pa09g0770 [Persea americana]
MDLLVSKQLLEALKASFEMHMTVLSLPIDKWFSSSLLFMRNYCRPLRLQIFSLPKTTPHLVLYPCSILNVILLSFSMSQMSGSLIGNSLWIGTPRAAICQTPMLASHDGLPKGGSMLCKGGELLDRILSRGGKYSVEEARVVIIQILNEISSQRRML